MGNQGSPRSTKVFGSDLTAGGTGTSDTLTNYIVGTKLSAGIIGQYYDRVAHNCNSASGNYRLGVYDGGASKPTNLYVETGSNAVSSGFNWQTVTEFALTSTIVYEAILCDGAATWYANSSGGARSYKSGQTYQSLAIALNPWPSGTSEDAYTPNCKVGHS